MNLKNERQLAVIPATELKCFLEQEGEPFLQSIITTGYLPIEERPKSRGLYYEAYRTPDAKGAIVISHGFSETIEKYKEVIYYMVKNGYAVYLADHRGHGRSLRDTAHPNRIHLMHFSDYVSDLHLFLTRIVKPRTQELPLYLFAHSMGGAIGAAYLEAHPHVFQKAVFNSPMLRINFGQISETAALLLAFCMKLLGKGDTYAPGQHDFIPGELFSQSASSCEERFGYYQDKKEATALFQVSGSSYRWIYESARATKSMRSKKSCAKIEIPVLLFQCMHDDYVDARGIDEFIRHTPAASLVQVADCKHEIYNSADAVLQDYYKKIFLFLED